MNASANIPSTSSLPGSDTLYLIPARGGSKGVPGKNIRLLGGIPLIAHSIRHAMAAGADMRDIIVTTDSDDIRRAAEAEGLDVPFMRPAELAGDRSGSYEVILHALDEMEKRGRRYRKVVLLQPTSPLRAPEDITLAEKLWREDIDMVVGVRPAKTNPYYNAFEADSEGMLHISKGAGGYTRRQDAPEVWEYNGAIYVMSVESLRRCPMSGFRRVLPYPMPEERSVDIDTRLDFMIAESLLARRDADAIAGEDNAHR